MVISAGKHALPIPLIAGILALLIGVPISCLAAKKKKGVESIMTVASVRTADKGDTLTICFLRSQRFYKLPPNASPAYLKLLKESETKKLPVIIKRTSETSDVIIGVRKR